MSDWVHCNKCSVKHNGQITFFLAECGHIFCDRCVEKIKSSKKCIICSKSGQVIALNKDLEPNVLDFFLPMENHLKKAVEVYKFQLQHRNTLFQNLLAKYNYAKKEYINCHNTNKHLLKDNQMLRSMLMSASGRKVDRSQSTPRMESSDQNVTFQNSSMMSSIPAQMMMMTPQPNQSMKKYPGYPKRNSIYGSGSSGPSPAQRVPFGFGKVLETPVHRPIRSTMMSSLDELRRGKGR